MTPSGQLKMPRVGNYCLTVAGDGAADVDIAQGADVTATSANAQHAVEHIAGPSCRPCICAPAPFPAQAARVSSPNAVAKQQGERKGSKVQGLRFGLRASIFR